MTRSVAGPRLPRPLVLGPLLILVGLLCWALYVHQTNTEHHAYAHGGNPPTYVQLHMGKTYGIAIHGGVHREIQLGLAPGSVQCTAAQPGEAPGPLDVTAEAQDTKATDRIASFVSGIDGVVHVQCSGIGAVYLDNAADAAYDWSGFFLVLASLALLVGLPLALSGLRTMFSGIDPTAAGGLEFAGDREAHMVGTGPGHDLYAYGQPAVAEPERDLGGG
jgi:hypothetical protein